MAELNVNIGNLQLKNPVMTASGTFGYGIEYSDFMDISRLGGIFLSGEFFYSPFFLHEKSTKRDKCCMQYFFGYYFMNCIFFAILLRIREK